MNENTTPLHPAFLTRMKEMLGNEYPSFLSSFNAPRTYGLRINTSKITCEDFENLSPFPTRQIPWIKNGYFYDEDIRPSRCPYYQAGLYYLQEPSAMTPASRIPIEPGDRVLDLCAAPGGKATAAGAALQGQGLLVANDISTSRARALLRNLELFGIPNVFVANETPAKLTKAFPEFFDKIILDAPCSGEGMFRKEEALARDWTPEKSQELAAIQRELILQAADMLRPGGQFLYSTCTFAPEENEGSISRFLEKHPEFSIVAVEKKDGMSAGVPEWISRSADGIGHTIRLWPHRLKGEGHYLAVLKKAGELPDDYRGGCRSGEQMGLKEKDCKECMEFLDTYFKKKPTGILVKFGDQIYLAPEGSPSLKGLKVLRPGLHLGTVKKNRFEPSHALALASKASDVTYSTDLPSDGAEIRAYLNGQTINREGEKGWYLITTDGYSIGWGKLAGGIMKNHYPKGLRKNW